MAKVVKKLKYKTTDTELSDNIYFKVDNGEGLDYVDNRLKVKPATATNLGGVKPDGTSITIDLDGTIHSGSGSLEAGNGISIINNKINAKVDGQTVFFNQQGQLSSTGGGGGGVGSLTRDLIVNQLNGVIFSKTDLGANIYEIEPHNDLLLLSQDGKPIQWSTDGDTWNTGSSINGGYFLRSIEISGQTYAYMSARNSAQYSSDGKTWTDYSLSGVSNYWNMCSNGQIVVQGTDKGVFASSDGITWAATDLVNGGYGRYNIAYGNARFVIGGANGIYYSVDGWHWTQSDYVGNQLNGIVYGTSGFVAYSCNNSAGYYYSADGVHWEKTNVEEGISGDVVFGQGYFLGCISGVGMFYSDNGKDWIQTSVAKDSFMNGADVQTFKFIRGIWIGCGNKGIFYSTDGKNWYPSNIAETTYDAVYFNNSIFVTGDKTKYIYKFTPSSVIYGNNIANATKTDVGVVKPDGTTIDVSADGTLTSLGESGESIINKINLNSNKQIFANKVTKATSFSLGVIRPDNKTTFVNTDGVLSAVGGTPGLVPGQGIRIDGDIISLRVDGTTLKIDTNTNKLTLVNATQVPKKKLKSFGANYQGGQGITVQDEMISVNYDETYIGLTADGALTLVDPNAEEDKGTIMNSIGDYSGGNGIVINENNVVSVKVDNEYIGFNDNEQLKILKYPSPQSIVAQGIISDITVSKPVSRPYCYNGHWVMGVATEDTSIAHLSNGIFYSTDGKTWERSNIKSGAFYQPYCYDGHWVISSKFRGGYYSTDGKNWIEIEDLKNYSTKPPYCYNGHWVIGTNDGIYYSDDGINWVKSTGANPHSYTKPYCYNGHWVIGNLDELLYSIDGKTWEQCSGMSSEFGLVTDAAPPYCYNGHWVIGTNDGIYYSDDGINWVRAKNIIKNRFRGSYCYKGTWVIAGDIAFTSTDGKNWQRLNDHGEYYLDFYCMDFYCYKGLWCVCAYAHAETPQYGGILCSRDLYHWTRVVEWDNYSYVYCYEGLWVFPNAESTSAGRRLGLYAESQYTYSSSKNNINLNEIFNIRQQYNSLLNPIVNKTTKETALPLNIFLTFHNQNIVPANQGDEIIGIAQNSEERLAIVGCLTVQDDGSCIVGQKCNVSHDGIATLSEQGYTVLERISDNLIKIIFK